MKSNVCTASGLEDPEKAKIVADSQRFMACFLWSAIRDITSKIERKKIIPDESATPMDIRRRLSVQQASESRPLCTAVHYGYRTL